MLMYLMPRLHKPFIAGLARVQRALKWLHMSRLAWFQDESVLAQLGLSNRVRSVPTQAMCRLIVFCKFLKMTREYQGKEDACGPSIRKKAEVG